MADEIVTPPAVLDTPGGGGRDVVRAMLAETARPTMERETAARRGAGYGERSGARENSRNGYRDRLWDTRAGSVEPRVPSLRRGSYLPSFLEPRRTAEKARVAGVQEACLQGVPTRAVDELAKALGPSGVSRSEVSRLCEEVEARVRELLARPLEGESPLVWLDGTYVKVRDGGRIVGKAAILAVGPSSQGRREVLGVRVDHSEGEPFGTELLLDRLDRGLRGVRLVVSDARSGLRRAVERCLARSWQRCRAHLVRSLLAHAPQGRRDPVEIGWARRRVPVPSVFSVPSVVPPESLAGTKLNRYAPTPPQGEGP